MYLLDCQERGNAGWEKLQRPPYSSFLMHHIVILQMAFRFFQINILSFYLGLSEISPMDHWICQRQSWKENTDEQLFYEAMMGVGRGKAFLLLFLCLGELTLPAEGRGAVGKGSSGRSFKGRSGRGGGGRGADQNPFNSLSSLHWWQVIHITQGESNQFV